MLSSGWPSAQSVIEPSGGTRGFWRRVDTVDPSPDFNRKVAAKFQSRTQGGVVTGMGLFDNYSGVPRREHTNFVLAQRTLRSSEGRNLHSAFLTL